MATSQMMRTEDKTGTWTSMFPAEQVTEQQSTLFAKKLLAVAISNITYLRAIFPERAYGDRCLGDLNLKILRDDSSCPGASQVIKWVKGCFDALERKYLRALLIGIYLDVNNPQTVVESYTFKFSYTNNCGVEIYRNDKKISSAQTLDTTKKETIQLLRTIIVLNQTLQPLPDNVMLTMKILYYDDVTPPDYEPPGFKASNFDSFDFNFEPLNIKIGDVSTKFHNIKLRCKTDGGPFMIKDDQENKVINNGLDQDNEIQLNQKKTEEAVESMQPESANIPVLANLIEGDVPSEDSPAKPEERKDVPPPTPSSTKDEEFVVRCPCGHNEDDGLMIVCDKCNFWQHGVCFRILDEENAPEEHVCNVCVQADASLKATDPYLDDLDTYALQATCLWRRTLGACSDFKRMLPHQLAHRLTVDNTVAQGLVKRLEKEGLLIAAKKGSRLGRMVDQHKIAKEAIPAYFKLPPKNLAQSNNDSQLTDIGMEASKENQHPGESKEASQAEVNDQLTQVMEKAANISIESTQLRTSTKKKRGLTQVLPEDTSSVSNQTTIKQRPPKRAFSKVDKSEFDVECSQDQHDTRSSKRRKCSDVTKALNV